MSAPFGTAQAGADTALGAPGVPHVDAQALIGAALRFRYLAAAALASGLVALLYGQVLNDWGYVQSGAHHLFTGLPDGGLHLYAKHAELQMGPVTFALAWVADDIAGVHSLLLLTLLGTAMLFPTLRLAELGVRRLPGSQPARPVVVLAAFAITTALWVQMPLFGHLDDCLVLLPLTAAFWAIACERPVLGAVLVGLACAGKPWGVVGLPLLLAPLPGRSRWRAFAVAVGVVAMVYGPFLLADLHTLTAGKPTLLVDRLSSLQLLGIARGSHPWGWLRAVQFGVAVALGAVAVARRQLSSALLIGIAVRLLLDPGSNPYFPAGLALVALVFDMASESRWPVTSLLALVVWLPSFTSTLPSAIGTIVRTAALLLLIWIACAMTPSYPWGWGGTASKDALGNCA